MMDFALSEEQLMLVRSIRRFIDEELKPLEAAVEETGELPSGEAERIHAKSKALGFYAMNVPAEYGGGGLNTVDWILAEEQFGRTTDILIRRAFGNVYDILFAGSDEQKDRWLRPCVAGERTCSIAFTEPVAGSDAAAVKTVAEPTGDGWRLNGHKHFISDAHHSDFFIVTAVMKPDAGHRGISTFIVDREMEGVTVGPNQEMMGLRGTTHAELFFDDVALSPVNLLGSRGEGLKLALATLGKVRLAQIGARAIGRSARILETAIEHARSREQFGKPIGEFQMIQQMLADSAAEIAAARLLLFNTAWKIDQGEDARAQISMVKVQASEVLGRVADRAVQIFGGYGYAKGLDIERFYRDARIFRIFDGTSEIHRGLVARRLMAGDTGLYQMVT